MIITAKLDKSIVAAMVLAAGICSGAVDDANKMFSTGQPEEYPEELENCNPLEVTTSEDVNDPTDGKISFREACLYLEKHYKAPAQVCEDQWPKITFALPAGKRVVTVSAEVVISDANRIESFGDGLSDRQPVIIDGGDAGLEIRNVGTGATLLSLDVAGVVSNVLFSGGTVAVGENMATSADRYVLFDNCAFAGGNAGGYLASSTWGNVRFVGCSFSVPSGASALGCVDLNVVSNQVSQFASCTFSGLKEASGVIVFRDCGGELRLVNCTFAQNEGVIADVLIASIQGASGVFRAFNCIFADVPCEKAYVMSGSRTTTVYCELTDPHSYDSTRKGELMMNTASASPLDVFDSSDRFSRVVKGVPQFAFKPRHAFSARYGRPSSTFPDGIRVEQPGLDVFGNPQTGRHFSMGSYYVDDIERPSVDVTTGEDVTDSYDDEISLREAIDYGGRAAGDAFVKGLSVTPTFWGGKAGDVLLTVTGAVHVATNGTYRNFALVIEPGEGQSLTISTATNSPNGVFAQDAGTKLLQFRKVTFADCGAARGDGGVLTTDGKYRFDDCTFSGCWAAGLREPDYGRVVDTVNGLVSRLRSNGYPDAFGLASVCQVTNAREVVQKAEREISSARDLVEMQRIAETASLQLKGVVDEACEALTKVKLSLVRETLVGPSEYRPMLEDVLVSVKNLQTELEECGSSVGRGRGGAVSASASADGIFHNVSASGCLAAGAGGVIANAGRLVGVNLTFCRNAAQSGSAVHCSDGTNLFASVAFVDNVSKTNGAVHVDGGVCGIVNSLVVGNVDSAGSVCNITAADGATTNVQYTLCGADVAKTEVLANGGEPIVAVVSNRVEQLYYPLKSAGPADCTGAYVFFLTEKGGDDLDKAGWIKGVLYSTEPDDFNPKPLVGGKVGCNTYLLHDQLGNLIESWDWRNQRALPASMGPVPKAVAVVPVTPGEPLVFDTPEAATNAAMWAELTPSAEVAAVFGGDANAKAAYCAKFGFAVVPTSDDKWAVVAGIKPEAWTNVIESARAATRQIPVADIATVAVGVPTNVTVEGCIPGFYYSIFGGSTATNLRAFVSEASRNVLCEPNKPVTFSEVVKPSDAAGFFTIGVSATRQLVSDTVRNVAREVGGGLYLGDDEIELDQGFVVIKGTDVRFVGNTVGELSDAW